MGTVEVWCAHVLLEEQRGKASPGGEFMFEVKRGLESGGKGWGGPWWRRSTHTCYRITLGCNTYMLPGRVGVCRGGKDLNEIGGLRRGM